MGAAVKGSMAIFVAAITLALSVPAAAGFTGNDMLPYCEVRLGDLPPGEATTAALMHGDCSGVVSTLMIFTDLMIEGPRFCPPKGATTKQGVHIVVKALMQHPETLHKGFADLAHLALLRAWPCGAVR